MSSPQQKIQSAHEQVNQIFYKALKLRPNEQGELVEEVLKDVIHEREYFKKLAQSEARECNKFEAELERVKQQLTSAVPPDIHLIITRQLKEALAKAEQQRDLWQTKSENWQSLAETKIQVEKDLRQQRDRLFRAAKLVVDSIAALGDSE